MYIVIFKTKRRISLFLVFKMVTLHLKDAFLGRFAMAENNSGSLSQVKIEGLLLKRDVCQPSNGWSL